MEELIISMLGGDRAVFDHFRANPGTNDHIYLAAKQHLEWNNRWSEDWAKNPAAGLTTIAQIQDAYSSVLKEISLLPVRRKEVGKYWLIPT